jgi:hypothetical protein
MKKLVFIIPALTFFSISFAKAYTFVNWTQGMTDTMLADVSAFITDLSPFIIPVIAILLGLVIIYAIVGAIRGHN